MQGAKVANQGHESDRGSIVRILSRTLAIVLAACVALAAPATAEVRLERTFQAGSASTSTKTEAPALVLGGTFVILATVYGAAQAALRVDSGATDVVLPRSRSPSTNTSSTANSSRPAPMTPALRPFQGGRRTCRIDPEATSVGRD